jgi:hypothetical protein
MGMSIEDKVGSLQTLKYSWEVGLRSLSNPVEIGIYEDIINSLDTAMDTMHKYQQLEDFARWVATEVIDEEMWTYNHLSFAELACRKLVQLGIMQESDGEYSYEVVEDGNNRA